MGDGQSGELQQLVTWSNQATEFARKSAAWKKEWSPESVGRKNASEVTQKGIVYCLSPAASGGGMKILKEGNATSLAYESYLKSHPDDNAVRAAYDNHERNLQSFHEHWNATDKSARCSGS